MTEVSAERSEWGRFAPDSVERRMLEHAGTALGVVLRPRTVVLERARVEVEGIDEADRLVVQLVANQGAYKPAWRNKVMADLFKLLWLRRSVPGVERAVLVVAEPAARALAGWVSVAAADLGVEVLVWDGTTAAPSSR
ncbi:hypothetical protein N8D77_15030 [Curtobacterium flaccumfaciens]|uniref:hypothetical protein n=1 Tax=Curtobacterium flaccumfaciens TaxID=2035 RepID=UPI0021C5E632|nr:hypothetical protein [Curtobacterium flaccumfaciens]UXN21445.1 hypothetical protein N8D77_15030 [Curtobacterium flaccumfaciens pv. flaccumfaciens]